MLQVMFFNPLENINSSITILISRKCPVGGNQNVYLSFVYHLYCILFPMTKTALCIDADQLASAYTVLRLSNKQNAGFLIWFNYLGGGGGVFVLSFHFVHLKNGSHATSVACVLYFF